MRLTALGCIALLLASVGHAAPVTVDVTGGLYMVDGTLVPASTAEPATVRFRLSAPIQAAAADGSGDLEWVAQFTSTVTVTNSSAFSVSLVPNTCDDCTVNPATSYYDVRVQYTGGSFTQRWIVPCSDSPSCPDVLIGTVPVNSVVDATIDALASTGDTATGMIIFDAGITLSPSAEPTSPVSGTMYVSTAGDLYLYTNGAFVAQGAGAGLDTAEVLAGSGIQVGVEGTSVRITNTASGGIATLQSGIATSIGPAPNQPNVDSGTITPTWDNTQNKPNIVNSATAGTGIVNQGNTANPIFATDSANNTVTWANVQSKPAIVYTWTAGTNMANQGNAENIIAAADSSTISPSWVNVQSKPSLVNDITAGAGLANSGTASSVIVDAQVQIPLCIDSDTISPRINWDRGLYINANNELDFDTSRPTLTWSQVSKSGSNLTDLSTRNHQDLQSIPGGADGYHLTLTHHTDLTYAGDCSIHFHASDRARANHTGTQTRATISNLDDDGDISHNSLGSLDTGDYRHLTLALHTDMTDGGLCIAHIHELGDDADTDIEGDTSDPTVTRANGTRIAHQGGPNDDGDIEPRPWATGMTYVYSERLGAGQLEPTYPVTVTDVDSGASQAVATIKVTGSSAEITIANNEATLSISETSFRNEGDQEIARHDHFLAGENLTFRKDSTGMAILDALGGGGGSLTGQLAGGSDTTVDTINVSIDGQMEATLSGDTLTISGTTGKIVQVVYAQSTEIATTTTTVPNDDTPPTTSEGAEAISASITPRRVGNILMIKGHGFFGSSATANIITSLVKGGETEARAATFFPNITSINSQETVLAYVVDQAGPITWSLRYGPSGAATVTLNGYASARKFGATVKTYLEIIEVQP